MKKLTTIVHRYRFDVSNLDESIQYENLSSKLKRGGYLFFNVLSIPPSGPKEPKDGSILELDDSYLFSNQWNTKCGLRVFDWFEPIYPNKKIKDGYYLELNRGMKIIRKRTLSCGYCGRQKKDEVDSEKFCHSCLGSEHLAQSNLFLLRLLPVSLHLPKRKTLSGSELSLLLPMYHKAQQEAFEQKAKKQRIKIILDRDKAIRSAKEEADGLLWLLDNGLSIDNVIYYNHAQIFNFGWRKKISDDQASILMDTLVEFPFDYKIEGESRKWSGK